MDYVHPNRTFELNRNKFGKKPLIASDYSTIQAQLPIVTNETKLYSYKLQSQPTPFRKMRINETPNCFYSCDPLRGMPPTHPPIQCLYLDHLHRLRIQGARYYPHKILINYGTSFLWLRWDKAFNSLWKALSWHSQSFTYDSYGLDFEISERLIATTRPWQIEPRLPVPILWSSEKLLVASRS